VNNTDLDCWKEQKNI